MVGTAAFTGNNKKHSTGAHKHDWKDGKRGGLSTLTDYDLEANADIIQRGVNYFDKSGNGENH